MNISALVDLISNLLYDQHWVGSAAHTAWSQLSEGGTHPWPWHKQGRGERTHVQDQPDLGIKTQYQKEWKTGRTEGGYHGHLAFLSTLTQAKQKHH